MSDSYDVRVFELNVSRRTTEAPYNNPGEVGDIQTIEVGATRSKSGETNAARYTVSYGVSSGVAEVKSTEPTERNHSNPTVETTHLAHILAETDSVVQTSIPEVESVRPLNATLRNQRAKQEDPSPEGTAESIEREQARTDGGSE